MQTKMEIGQPEKLEVYRGGGKLAIERRWFGWHIIFTSVFALFWNGFLVFWYSMARSSGDLMALLFPLMHVAVGIGIAYYSLAGWFNRSLITVGEGKIVVRHGPLPWWGNKDVESRTIQQLYVKEKANRSRNSARSSYDLHALTTDGRSFKLMAGFPESDQALYVEQEVEKFLGIPDAEVKGAVQ
jgi:hypothetical protein